MERKNEIASLSVKEEKKEEDDEGEHLEIISIYMKCKKNHTRTVVIDQMQLVKKNSAIV